MVENHLNVTCSECQEIIWRSIRISQFSVELHIAVMVYSIVLAFSRADRGHIPRDSRLILVKHMSIYATVSMIIFFLSSIGIVMSFSFLAFNFHHRKQRFVICIVFLYVDRL